MKKNTIVGLGTVCFIVVFFAIASGTGIYQQISSKETSETPAYVEAPLEGQKKSDFDNQPKVDTPTSKPLPVKQGCLGDARCISGFVTRIVDGDTISVDGQSIRFALVNTPEYGEYDYSQARSYIETICPIGSKVLVDEDDLQTKGSHGRIIGVIYCNNLNLSEEILEVGHAEILASICPKSEFVDEPWAQKFGC